MIEAIRDTVWDMLWLGMLVFLWAVAIVVGLYLMLSGWVGMKREERDGGRAGMDHGDDERNHHCYRKWW